MRPCIRRALRNQLDNPALPIVVYLAVVGLLAMASGGGAAPETVQHSTPPWLTHAWTLSLAGGGCLAVAGCLTGRTRGESAGLALLIFGLGLYGLADAVKRWPLGLETATALLALMACCAIRLRVLHLARKAVRHAKRGCGVPPWTG